MDPAGLPAPRCGHVGVAAPTRRAQRRVSGLRPSRAHGSERAAVFALLDRRVSGSAPARAGHRSRSHGRRRTVRACGAAVGAQPCGGQASAQRMAVTAPMRVAEPSA
jgi:hypothetical protein